MSLNAGLVIREERSPQERLGWKLMVLDVLWLMAVSAALVVFFVFYLAFAFMLFSPLFDYLIEQAFPPRHAATWTLSLWGSAGFRHACHMGPQSGSVRARST